MREVLIRSPSVAFAFGINASQFAGACAPTGPSQAARPPAEHVGSGGTAAVTTAASPVGCEEVFVWGQSPGEWYVSPARQHHVHATVMLDRKSTRLNSSHQIISYAVFSLKKKKQTLHLVPTHLSRMRLPPHAS